MNFTIFVFGLILLLPLIVKAEDIKCNAPVLSQAKLAYFVAQERLKNEEFPKLMKNVQVEIGRKRCHYLYIEQGIHNANPARLAILINKNGIIVNYSQQAHALGAACGLSGGKNYSLEDLKEVMNIQRKKDIALPLKPIGAYKSFFTRSGCNYSYVEDDGKIQNSFSIDFNGDIFWIDSVKSWSVSK